MKTCYIVGAGEFYGDFTPDSTDLVIAADGGLDTLERLGKRYDILLGDMDSVKSDVSDKEKLLFPVEKDETDTFLAYREGVKRGYSKFMLFGCVGGRIDHTFANISLLIYAKNEGNDVTIVADGYTIFTIKNEKAVLRGERGKTFSVFAFGKEAVGVSISRAKYNADNITILPEYPLGVSNSLLESECDLEVKDGILVIMMQV